MSQRVDPSLFDIRVVEQVVGAVKQTARLHRPIFFPSPKKLPHWVLRISHERCLEMALNLIIGFFA
jgi:hypothetical protein